jgi:hypothetical protein
MKKILLFSVLLCSGIFLQAQSNAKNFNSDIPNHYFGFSLKLVKETPGFSPPVAARAFGYMGLALYEAMVPGMPTYTSAQGVVLQLPTLSGPGSGAVCYWPMVANNVLAFMLDSLFPTAVKANKDSLLAIRTYYNTLFQNQLSVKEYNDSKIFAEQLADAIFQFSKTDGGHAGYSKNFPPAYVPPVGPGFWVPLTGQMALQPYWGSNRPFIQADTASAIQGKPEPYSTDTTSAFYKAAWEVYTNVKNTTPDHTLIAGYWADGTGSITPPGHSVSILRNIIRDKNLNLEEAAIAYAKLGMAVSDAFITCWKIKFKCNVERPITYIHSHIDSSWNTIIPTPPFPECNSGHSSQSGAMAEILESIVGKNYSFTDSTNGSNLGGPRQFPSLDSAAREAAASRLYGGIHYTFSNRGGFVMGRAIGANINQAFKGLNAPTIVNEQTQQADLIVYPNPATDLLHITTDGLKFNQVGIYNMLGERVIETALNNSISIDLSLLAPGIYTVRAYDQVKNYTLNKAFVKQ